MSNPMFKPLTIYNMPNSGGQVHIHGDAVCGRIYDTDRSVYKPLNAYESAMADYNAQALGFKPIIK